MTKSFISRRKADPRTLSRGGSNFGRTPATPADSIYYHHYWLRTGSGSGKALPWIVAGAAGVAQDPPAAFCF